MQNVLKPAKYSGRQLPPVKSEWFVKCGAAVRFSSGLKLLAGTMPETPAGKSNTQPHARQRAQQANA
jgi:hypothetical protein